MNLLDLMIKVGVDDQASSGLDRIVGGVKNAASTIGGAVKSAVDVGVKLSGVAAGAFAALGGAALSAAGDLEQNTGGMAQVFKENAAAMEATAKTAFGNMGLSASDFMATANQMGALFQGSGFSIDESATLAAESMQRAADVASIMGIDVSRAMESVAGAAKGNFTMMDNLGVAINDTTIAQYALSKGITTSTREMSTQQKVGLALELFMEKSAYAAGNYARENQTLAGSLNTAKSAMSNFLSGAGSASAVADSFSNAAKVMVKNLQEIIPRLTEGLQEIAEQLAPEIPVIFETALPAIVEGAKSILTGVAKTLPDLAQIVLDSIPAMVSAVGEVGRSLVVAIQEVARTLVVSFSDMLYQFTGIDISPLLKPLQDVGGLIKDAFGSMTEGIDLTSVSEKVNGFIEKLAGAISKVVTAVQGDTFKGFVEDIKGFFGSVKGGLQTILTPVADGVKKLFAAFTGGDAGIMKSITDAFGAFAKWFEGNLAPAIGDVATAVFDLLEPFAEGVGTLITEIGDALGKVFQYATEGKASPLQRIADSFAKFVDAFKPYLSETIKNIAESLGNFFEALGTGIIDRLSAFAGALEKGDGFISSLLTHIGETITKISEFVLTLTDSTATTEEKLGKLGEVFGTVFSKIKEALKEAVDFVIQKFNELKSFIENFSISAAIDGLKQKSSDALENIKSGWNAFWGGAEKGYTEDQNRSTARSTYATPTAQIPYNESVAGKSTADLANTVIAGAIQTGSKTVNINTNIDGQRVAQVVYDPLSDVVTQKGVPIGG